MGRTPRKTTKPTTEETPQTPSKNIPVNEPCTPSAMKVNELKEALVARGLSPKGLKKELVERLEEALVQPSQLVESLTVDQLDESPAVVTAEQVETVEHVDKSQDAEADQVEATEVTETVEQDSLSKVGGAIEREIVGEELIAKKAKITVAETEQEGRDKEQESRENDEESREKDEESREKVEESREKDEEIDYSEAEEPEAKAEASWTPRTKRAPKPLAPSTVVHITGFVRPFTLQAARDLVEKYGITRSFWMDTIKSHAYVHFEDCEMSRDCREALDGVVWPLETGKRLSATYSTVEEMKAVIEPEAKKTATVPTSPVASVEVEAMPVESSSAKSLDELFHKTKALPHLYYKPAVPL